MALTEIAGCIKDVSEYPMGELEAPHEIRRKKRHELLLIQAEDAIAHLKIWLMG